MYLQRRGNISPKKWRRSGISRASVQIGLTYLKAFKRGLLLSRHPLLPMLQGVLLHRSWPNSEALLTLKFSHFCKSSSPCPRPRSRLSSSLKRSMKTWSLKAVTFRSWALIPLGLLRSSPYQGCTVSVIYCRLSKQTELLERTYPRFFLLCPSA